jgi:hypothetical protein
MVNGKQPNPQTKPSKQTNKQTNKQTKENTYETNIPTCITHHNRTCCDGERFAPGAVFWDGSAHRNVELPSAAS